MLVIMTLLVQSTLASHLTPIEQRICSQISDQSNAQLRLLERLVNINSGTNNIDGVLAVGDIVEKQLNDLGFDTWWVDEPRWMHKAPTLVAQHAGTYGQKILLIGHLDTVFSMTGSFQLFKLKSSQLARGAGTLDDKGGIVVMLYALKALQAVHALDHENIIVVLTGDEEESGKPASISRQPLIRAARQSDIALDFESAVTLDTGSIGRRGISNWLITSHGNESHSATIFQQGVGDGAIFEMARILNSMRLQFGINKDVTYNPGMIAGGTHVAFDGMDTNGTAFGKNNVVSKIAVARGDFRYLTVKEREQFKEKLSKIVKQHLPGTYSEVSYIDGIPAMAPIAANIALLHEYSHVSEDLSMGKVKVLDPALRGAGDISYVSTIEKQNLVGLGPMGLGAHSVIETVELKSIPIQTKRAALLIYRLTSHDHVSHCH